MNFKERWNRLTWNDYGQFACVAYPKSQRRDMHAMMLLDELFPSQKLLLQSSFGHLDDEVYFSINQNQLNTLTDEQIIELARCGVQYDHLMQRLWMPV